MTAAVAARLIEDATEVVQSGSMHASPLVTVALVTHQHAAFLREAIEGVLAQQTAFSVELLIADDASSDGSVEMAIDYQCRYPERIKVLRARQNLGRHTGNGRLNFVRALSGCRGRYVALLDGDDCWTDVGKLQKQVDLLERFPECAGSYHETAETDSSGAKILSIVPGHSLEDVGVEDVVSPMLCFHTSSVVLRRSAIPAAFPDWFFRVLAADLPLFALAARHGPLRRVAGRMSLWRRHGSSITTGPEHRGVEVHVRRIEQWLALRHELDSVGQAAVDRTCAWHRAQVVERVDLLQRQNEALRSVKGVLRLVYRRLLRYAGNAVGRSP